MSTTKAVDPVSDFALRVARVLKDMRSSSALFVVQQAYPDDVNDPSEQPSSDAILDNIIALASLRSSPTSGDGQEARAPSALVEAGKMLRERVFFYIDKGINHGINDPKEDTLAFKGTAAWDAALSKAQPASSSSPLGDATIDDGDTAQSSGPGSPLVSPRNGEDTAAIRIATLPQCKHGRSLSDWGGNWLELPCGCCFDNATPEQQRVMSILKLRLPEAPKEKE